VKERCVGGRSNGGYSRGTDKFAREGMPLGGDGKGV